MGTLPSASQLRLIVILICPSLSSFTPFRYGDIHPVNSSEHVFATVLILVLCVVSAYILGTMTALIVAADEQASLLASQFLTSVHNHVIVSND